MKINLRKYTFSYDGIIFDAIYKIKINKIKTLFIEKNSKIIGVLDIEDILNSFLNGVDIYSSVNGVYNKSFKYLKDKNFNKAKQLFNKFNLIALPILNHKHQLCDLITIKDFLKI